MSKEMYLTYILREHEKLTYKEIAELLNIKIGTVRSRLYRAREHIARNR